VRAGPRTHRGTEGGFTLIEFVMAVALGSVVFMLLYTMLDTALDVWGLGQLRSNAVQTARQTMTTMADEIENASEIYYAGSDSILFRYKTIEQVDAVNSQEVEWLVKYAYRAGPGEVVREYSELSPVPSVPVENTFATSVSGFSFDFYDSFYSATTVLYRIRFIGVDLRLQSSDYNVALHNLVTLQNPRLMP
jgi:prepilin-type N-terminal cleavage/methylation domain-containing protein